MSEFDPNWLREVELLPKVILDVGCHRGEDTVRFGEAFPIARVLGIEADPKNYLRCLRRKSKIEFYNYAIRNYTGETDFYPSSFLIRKGKAKRWTASGSVFESDPIKNDCLNFANAIKIPCITLAEFCLRSNILNIDLLHMDVQGAEEEVFESLGEIKPTFIFAEVSEFEKYKTGTSIKEFEEIVIKNGYKVKKRLRYDTLFERV